MKTIKQTIRNATLGLLMMFGLGIAALPVSPTFAQSTCGGVTTSIINCDDGGVKDGTNDINKDGKKDYKDSAIWAILIMIVNFLTAGVGVVALAGIVYGAILYTSAGGNAEQVKKAYGIFFNVGIGVVAFAGMWALLNFLIPGGAFNL